MEFFVAAGQTLDRRQALEILKSALATTLGRPVEVAETSFMDNSLAGLLARDGEDTLYVITWLEGDEFESRLFEILGDYKRIVARRDEIARRCFSTAPAAGCPSVQLIGVCERLPEAWLEIAATLAIEVKFIRVHRLAASDASRQALYFELRPALSPAISETSAPFPNGKAETKTKAPIDGREAKQATERADQSATFLPWAAPEIEEPPPEPGAVPVPIMPPEPPIEEEPEPLPQPSTPHPYTGLSAEEIESFKALENLLQSSGSRN